MSELLWFGPDPVPATCQHENLRDSSQVGYLLYCKKLKVCLNCQKGFIEGKANKVMANGCLPFFEAPVDATKKEVMSIACDVVGTYGEDISSIIVFEGDPKIKWQERYYMD